MLQLMGIRRPLRAIRIAARALTSAPLNSVSSRSGWLFFRELAFSVKSIYPALRHEIPLHEHCLWAYARVVKKRVVSLAK